MLRVFSAATLGLFLITGLALAGDYRGYLKAVEKDKFTVTVEEKGKEKDEVKDKDLEIKLDDKTQLFAGKEAIKTDDLTKLIKDAGERGLRVHVTTKGSGPEEIATEVRVAGKR